MELFRNKKLQALEVIDVHGWAYVTQGKTHLGGFILGLARTGNMVNDKVARELEVDGAVEFFVNGKSPRLVKRRFTSMKDVVEGGDTSQVRVIRD